MKPRTAVKEEPRPVPAPAMLQLDVTSLGGEPDVLLDAVQRNVERAAAVLGRLTGAGFRCGCVVTLAADREPASPWRVMAWNDTRCGSTAHRALRAQWEARNLG